MRAPHAMQPRNLGTVLVAVLALVSCGGSDDSSTSSGSASGTARPTTTESATTNSCGDDLERGCTGEDVERLQRLLRGRIDGSVAVTGTFGDATERALLEFEDLRCDVCVVDGKIRVDGPEWKELVGLSATTTERPREPSP